MSTQHVTSQPRRDAAQGLAGCSLVVAPLLLLLWNALDPASSDDAAVRLGQIAADEARYVAAGYLALIAVWAFVPGLVGLWSLFRGRSVIGQVGAGLMVVGMITTVTFFGFGISEYEAAQSGRDAAQMATLAGDVESSPVAIPLLVVFLVGAVLGSLLVAWALWRQQVVPVWSSLAIVLGVLVNFVANAPALSALASALTLVGFGWVGLRILSMTPDAWRAARAGRAHHGDETVAIPH